jgi:hypothetical protein
MCHGGCGSSDSPKRSQVLGPNVVINAARSRIAGGREMNSIILLIDYFGQWPEWFPLYLETCRQNPTIDWLFHSDCAWQFGTFPNIKYVHISRQEYLSRVNESLGIRFTLANNYKVCDLRPTFGILHSVDIIGYDFFGYGDVDVLYGNLRQFCTQDVLMKHVFSTHAWGLSGHFALLRNTSAIREAFLAVPDWRAILENPLPQRFDEDIFSAVFRSPEYAGLLHWKEAYTTPLIPRAWWNGSFEHPQTWYWHRGRVTNNKDGDKQFIYLHFMNYKEARFLNPIYGDKPFWNGLDKVVHVAPGDYGRGIRLDRNGIHSLTINSHL